MYCPTHTKKCKIQETVLWAFSKKYYLEKRKNNSSFVYPRLHNAQTNNICLQKLFLWDVCLSKHTFCAWKTNKLFLRQIRNYYITFLVNAYIFHLNLFRFWQLTGFYDKTRKKFDKNLITPFLQKIFEIGITSFFWLAQDSGIV